MKITKFNIKFWPTILRLKAQYLWKDLQIGYLRYRSARNETKIIWIKNGY